MQGINIIFRENIVVAVSSPYKPPITELLNGPGRPKKAEPEKVIFLVIRA
jgi:hypothetical protein